MAYPSFTCASTATDHDYAVVPTTGTDLASVSRGLWIAHSGATSFTVLTANGDSVTIPVQAGMQFLPLRVKQVSANTNNVSIVALL